MRRLYEESIARVYIKGQDARKVIKSIFRPLEVSWPHFEARKSKFTFESLIIVLLVIKNNNHIK